MAKKPVAQRAVDTVRDLIGPKSDDGYCHCPRPITDADLPDLAGDEDWCWLCHKPLPEDGLIDRLVKAFLA